MLHIRFYYDVDNNDSNNDYNRLTTANHNNEANLLKLNVKIH